MPARRNFLRELREPQSSQNRQGVRARGKARFFLNLGSVLWYSKHAVWERGRGSRGSANISNALKRLEHYRSIPPKGGMGIETGRHNPRDHRRDCSIPPKGGMGIETNAPRHNNGRISVASPRKGGWGLKREIIHERRDLAKIASLRKGGWGSNQQAPA